MLQFSTIQSNWLIVTSNCCNPIFTFGISSGIGMQNEAVRLSQVRSDSSSNTSKSSQNMVGGTFPKVWKDLTNVDQV
jgi:hypothetical protein